MHTYNVETFFSFSDEERTWLLVVLRENVTEREREVFGEERVRCGVRSFG